jgi:acetoin utilization protein AcuB
MLVADWMTRNPITCEPGFTLSEARDIMKQGGFRRLPVVVAGDLVGIITDRDIRKKQVDLLRVNDSMIRNPITIEADAPLELAAEIFFKNKFGGLPVLDMERLVGIITQLDVLSGLFDYLGVNQGGFCFTFEVPQRESAILPEILRVVASQGALTLSVLSNLDRTEGSDMMQYVIRVKGAMPEQMIPHLKQFGVGLIQDRGREFFLSRL